MSSKRESNNANLIAQKSVISVNYSGETVENPFGEFLNGKCLHETQLLISAYAIYLSVKPIHPVFEMQCQKKPSPMGGVEDRDMYREGRYDKRIA